MKKYKDYMDRVKISSEAHDRILQAMKAQEEAGTAAAQKEEPLAKVTKLPWYRRSSFRTLAGATAALIVLVVGISAVMRNNGSRPADQYRCSELYRRSRPADRSRRDLRHPDEGGNYTGS